MSTHNKILQIYNSRKTVLELLGSYNNHEVKDYEGFSINEVDAMYNTDQLDMLITKTNRDTSLGETKTYVKYFLRGNLTDASLRPILEDLYQYSDTLNSKDCLFIVYDGEPTDSFLSHLDHLYKKENIFVVVHNIKRLQFNILKHFLVPAIEIMTDQEKTQLFQQYSITEDAQMPEISRYDPQALAMCVRPGEVCKISRKSPTSLNTTYYRVCV